MRLATIAWIATAMLSCGPLAAQPAFAKVTVGQPAPNFRATALDGRPITLDSLRGNVIVVNFWATWCGPCREELPLIDGYLRRKQKDGLRVLAVTTDADSIPVAKIRELQGALSFPLLKTFQGPYEPIGNAIPTNFIIDRDGVVRYAQAGAFSAEELDRIVTPLLSAPPATPSGGGSSGLILTGY